MLRLGEQLNFDQSFYMQLDVNGKREMLIVYVDMPEEGFYFQDGNHRSQAKYQKVKDLYQVEDEFLYPRNLFSGALNTQKLSLKNTKGRFFEMNLKLKEMKPKIPKNHELNQVAAYTFLEKLEQLVAKRVYFVSHLFKRVFTRRVELKNPLYERSFALVQNDGACLAVVEVADGRPLRPDTFT